MITTTFTTDEEGYRQADHAIFTCAKCGYSTTDLYTAGVINDTTGECPECGADALLVTEGGSGIWCDATCGWYEDDFVNEDLRP